MSAGASIRTICKQHALRHLAIQWRVHRVPLVLDNLALQPERSTYVSRVGESECSSVPVPQPESQWHLFPKHFKLPLHKRVVVRVDVGGNEAARPISKTRQGLE